MTTLIATASPRCTSLEVVSDKFLWSGDTIVSNNCAKWMALSFQEVTPDIREAMFLDGYDKEGVLYVGACGSAHVGDFVSSYISGQVSHDELISSLATGRGFRATAASSDSSDGLYQAELVLVSNLYDEELGSVRLVCLDVDSWAMLGFNKTYVGDVLPLPFVSG